MIDLLCRNAMLKNLHGLLENLNQSRKKRKIELSLIRGGKNKDCSKLDARHIALDEEFCLQLEVAYEAIKPVYDGLCALVPIEKGQQAPLLSPDKKSAPPPTKGSW